MYIIFCTIMCSVFSVLITVHVSLAGPICVLNSCVRHRQDDGDHFVMLRSDCTRSSSAIVEPDLNKPRNSLKNNQLVFMDVSYDFVAVSTISRHLGNQINQAFFLFFFFKRKKRKKRRRNVVFNLNIDFCLSLTPNFNLILCVLTLTKYIFVKRKSVRK